MEMAAGLAQDTLLATFFNEYLSMEVFGVRLEYRRGCIQEVGGNSLPELRQKQELVWKWCAQHRWDYFLKSRLYIEYRLCALLFPCLTRDSTPVVTRESIVSPWGQQEDCSWLQTTAKQATLDSRYENYKHLKGFLSFTHGNTLINIWLSLEAWELGMANDRTELGAVREQCLSMPGLAKLQDLCIGPQEAGTWVEAIKIKCEDRLFNYWLPRFKQRGQSTHSIAIMSCDMSCDPSDPNEPFRSGLHCNRIAGRPFESFLQSSDSKHCIHWVKFWEALDWTLLIQQSRSDQYVIREGWRLWSLYIEWHGSDSLIDACIPREYRESLLKSLTESNRCSVLKDLTMIQDAVLSSLKRVWTQFLRLDNLLFTQCVNTFSLSENADSKVKTSAKKSWSSKRQKKDKRLGEWMLDFKRTVLEPLGDFETLLCFEQYLFTECGPKSQPNINYQLWKMLKNLDRTTELKRRDSLAIQIYQNFLYLGAKRFLHLPDSLLGEIENKAEVARPSSPTLKALTEFSSLYLKDTVKKFITISQGSSSNKSLDSLPPLYNIRIAAQRRSKISSAMQQRNEAQHLLFTLTGCEGPISHLLQAFSNFLDHQSSPSQQGKLVNSVCFWLEVKKFQAMFVSETSIRVLFHKAEAIVDRYLDTASQPWIKVTVPSEVTIQVLSALGDLQKVEVYAHLERLHQLLVTTQEIVFEDMAPYWSTFCSQYTSPDGSTVSIPHSGGISPPLRTRRPTLQLPPITRPFITTPLLSFSSLMGLQWRTAF